MGVFVCVRVCVCVLCITESRVQEERPWVGVCGCVCGCVCVCVSVPELQQRGWNCCYCLFSLAV